MNEQERKKGRERREEEAEGREETEVIKKKKPFHVITQPDYVISDVPAEKSGKEDNPKKRGVKPNN